MTKSEDPLQDIRALINNALPDANSNIEAILAEKSHSTLFGLRPLGRLGAVLTHIAAMQGRDSPAINAPLIAVFLGTHRATGEILGSDPTEEAARRVESLSKGNTPIRGIANSVGAAYKLMEMGTDMPAADMRTEPSLTPRGCAASIAFGMECAAGGNDIVALGCAGVGSAAAAAAIAMALFGGNADYWAGGRDKGAKVRIAAVEAAAERHGGAGADPLEILRCYGGRDIAGLIGAIVATRHQKIPVLLDGFVTCAAAAIVHAVNPSAIDHCIAAHITAEPAHGALLDRIGKKPVLDLEIGIGDGTGGALALAALKSAAAGMNTGQS